MIKKWDKKLILEVFVNDKIITFPSSRSETPVSSVSNFTSLLLFQGNQSFGQCEYTFRFDDKTQITIVGCVYMQAG